MKINLVGYREWALKAFQYYPDLNILKSSVDLINHVNDSQNNQLFIFVGWSNYIEEKIIRDNTCVCLHPSDLPKFRGGSPIQNQKIRGVLHTKMTAFKMTDRLDAGPIIDKCDLDISGHMENIFCNLSEASRLLIEKIILNINNNKYLNGTPQIENDASQYKRRKPSQSELKITDLEKLTSTELYNFITSLEDPYPNAFFRTIDGKKLLLKKVELE